MNTTMNRQMVPVAITLVVFIGTVLAVAPPPLIHYQGVLRDNLGNPLTGDFDMVFRFHDQSIGGNLLLTDEHLAVPVANGLFDVDLGGGTVSPPLASLASVFADNTDVWLEIQVGNDAPMVPRIRVLATGYALNAGSLDGRDASDFLDTSETTQTKNGKLIVAASTDVGLRALGLITGGEFVGFESGASVANDCAGISASGLCTGGIFDGGDTGVIASGTLKGVRATSELDGVAGEFTNGSFSATLARRTDAAPFDTTGAAGEFFAGDAHAYLAEHKFEEGTYGIDAAGGVTGGLFTTGGGSGEAWLARGDTGVEASGTGTGGYFADSDSAGWARVGHGDTGIEAGGTIGGSFSGAPALTATGQESDASAIFTNGTFEAELTWWFTSEAGGGGHAGGFTGWDSFADVATYRFEEGPYGIYAGGGNAGGYFEDTDSGTFAQVAADSSKITGTGSVSFVQNHPYSPGEVIVYVAPEGDEVATYTRGTARLSDGEATIALGETFGWVTNPDIGLTAYLTPVGEWADLYVAEKSTTELVVRGAAGAPDAEFDYIVYGLRIGFEETSIVREKTREAYIPSMNAHRERYAARPELRRFNALERFAAMREAVGQREPLDRSASAALRAAIEEYDPLRHGPVAADRLVHRGPFDPAVAVGQDVANRPVAAHRSVVSGESTPRRPARASDDRVDLEGRGGDEPPETCPPHPATEVEVAGRVAAGDVLVIDADSPGVMRRSSVAADRRVFGVALGAFEPGHEDVTARAADAAASFGRVPVALNGIVYCNVDAGYGAIRAGDPLTTSPTAGHTMLALDATPGTIIGKALEPLEQGVGRIRILIVQR